MDLFKKLSNCAGRTNKWSNRPVPTKKKHWRNWGRISRFSRGWYDDMWMRFKRENEVEEEIEQEENFLYKYTRGIFDDKVKKELKKLDLKPNLEI